MFTDLKVSPLACKCVFHETEHNVNGATYKIEF